MNESEIISKIGELYGVPREVPKNSILLLTGAELLAITDILRDLATGGDTIKKIDDLEKPFKKNINSKESK